MYEFRVYHKTQDIEEIIFGRDLQDAFFRFRMDSAEWTVYACEYVD